MFSNNNLLKDLERSLNYFKENNNDVFFQGLSGSEASSETGLNRPITEDDSLNIGGRSYPSLPPHYPSLPTAYPSIPPAYPSHNFETILEAPENIQKVCFTNTYLAGNFWNSLILRN